MVSENTTSGALRRATTNVSFTKSGDDLSATLTMTGCDLGPHYAAECVPTTAPACVMKFKVTCLTFGRPDIYGFTSTEASNGCMHAPSPWKCDYALTGRGYQDQGHGAAFYMTMAWDSDPAAAKAPLRMNPFGAFTTSCPDDSTAFTLSGRFGNAGL
jgi:hypothetical protein